MIKKIKNNKKISMPRLNFIIFAVIIAAAAFLAGSLSAKITTNQTSSVSAVAFEPSAEEKSTFKFFTMSFCPYGNQAEEALAPVVDLLGEEANIETHYIFSRVDDINGFCTPRIYSQASCQEYITQGYFQTQAECKAQFVDSLAECKNKYLLEKDGVAYSALHGRGELNQNVREICAAKNTPSQKAWWDFVLSVNQDCNSENVDNCWEPLAKKAGFDTEAIKLCFNEKAIDIIESELAESDRYQAYGSPTFLVNGENFPPEAAYDQAGKASLKIGKKVIEQTQYRTSDTLKEAICAGFKKAPKACKTELSQEDSTQAAAAGGC